MLERGHAADAAAAELLALAAAAGGGEPLAPPRAVWLRRALADATGLLADATAALVAFGSVADIDDGEYAPPAVVAAAAGALSSLQLLECARGALRVVRNASAVGGRAGQAAVATSGAALAVREFLRYDAGAGEGGDAWNALLATTRRLAWQALANAVAGGGSAAAAAAVWALLQPGTGPALAQQGVLLPALEAARRDAPLGGVVASLLYSCCRDDDGGGGGGGGDPAVDAAAAAAARLAQLAGDRTVLPRLLSRVLVAGGGGDINGGDTSGDASVPWLVLLTGLLAKHGLLRAAFATAGAGTPLSLLMEDDGGGGAAAPRLTREQLRLLTLLEAHVDASLLRTTAGTANDDDATATTAATAMARSSPSSSPSSSSASSSCAQHGGQVAPARAPRSTRHPHHNELRRHCHRVLTDGDAAFLVDTLRALCACALSHAAALAAGEAAGDDAGACAHRVGRAALALRPVLTATCMLCDVLCDLLAQRQQAQQRGSDGGDDGDGGDDDNEKTGECSPGAHEAALLQELLLLGAPAPAPGSSDGCGHVGADGTVAGERGGATGATSWASSTPLGAALDLLHAATPPPRLRGDGPQHMQPPEMVDFNEETGEAVPVAVTRADGGGEGVHPHPPPPPEAAGDSGVGGLRPVDGPLPPPPPRLPATTVPAGTRSSLTRLVALASAGSPLAADVVLGRRSAAATTPAPTTTNTTTTDGGCASAPAGAPLPPPPPPAGSHGVYTLLAQCVVEGRNPLLREWGLLGVRNLCEASAGVVAAIEAAKATRVRAAPELAALGVRT